MDLLQTVRKSGSRGGVEFSWDDVKSSAHRENYLGHSLKAPVGRWQKNRDLNWYARSEDADLTPEQREERERLAREEERRGVKAAEAEAMARALGLPAPETVAGNANLEPVGTQRGELNGKRRRENEEMGNKRGSSRRDNAEGWPKWQRRRSRSRSPDAHGERRHRHRHRRHHDSRSRSRSKCRDKAWVRRREESSCSRSRSRERRKERSWRERRGGYDDARSRSRSPPRVQRQRSRTPDGRGKRRNDDFYQPRRDSRGYD